MRLSAPCTFNKFLPVFSRDLQAFRYFSCCACAIPIVLIAATAQSWPALLLTTWSNEESLPDSHSSNWSSHSSSLYILSRARASTGSWSCFRFKWLSFSLRNSWFLSSSWKANGAKLLHYFSELCLLWLVSKVLLTWIHGFPFAHDSMATSYWPQHFPRYLEPWYLDLSTLNFSRGKTRWNTSATQLSVKSWIITGAEMLLVVGPPLMLAHVSHSNAKSFSRLFHTMRVKQILQCGASRPLSTEPLTSTKWSKLVHPHTFSC